MRVCDLFKKGTRTWDENILDKYFCKEDKDCILNIKPSLYSRGDFVSRKFSKDGNYSTRSGYRAIRSRDKGERDRAESSSHGALRALYGKIWKLGAPPKIRHFWWKVLHNALPTADNLRRRRINADLDCPVCLNEVETLKHMLFTCQVSKEVWDLTSHRTAPWELDELSLTDILEGFIADEHSGGRTFPFIGWHIWKARNKLIFESKRTMIPEIIHKALTDYNLWQEANRVPDTSTNTRKHSKENQAVQRQRKSCYVDASWKNPNEPAGYGWVLKNEDGRIVIEAHGAMKPVAAPLIAEAQALEEAMTQVRRLEISDTTFYSDSKELYLWLQKSQNDRVETVRHVSRTENVIADDLAKKARINVSRTCNACSQTWLVEKA